MRESLQEVVEALWQDGEQQAGKVDQANAGCAEAAVRPRRGCCADCMSRRGHGAATKNASWGAAAARRPEGRGERRRRWQTF